MDQNRMSRDEYLFYQASATFLEKWTELRGKQPFEVKAHTVSPFEYFEYLSETTSRPPRRGIFG